MQHHKPRLSDRFLTKREFLSRAGIGMGSLALGAMLQPSAARASAESSLAVKGAHFRPKAKRVIHDLFEHFTASVDDLPAEWRGLAKAEDDTRVARVIADYIAGMTDNYALKCHDELFKADARV